MMAFVGSFQFNLSVPYVLDELTEEKKRAAVGGDGGCGGGYGGGRGHGSLKVYGEREWVGVWSQDMEMLKMFGFKYQQFVYFI